MIKQSSTRSVTDQDIYIALLGSHVIVGPKYRSPIPGRKDRTPSFGLYEKNGKILWRDFGLTNQFGNSAINLVQHMRNLPLTDEGFGLAKKLITQELKSGIIGTHPPMIPMVDKNDETPFIVDRDFRPYELDYWDRFSISKDILLHEDIRAISSMRWTSGLSSRSTPDDPKFVFWWAKSPVSSCKVYRPLAEKKLRFRQYNVDGVVEGWNSLVKEFKARGNEPFDVLFINSSTKDRLVVKKAMSGCSGINPRSEGELSDIKKKTIEIRVMSKRQIIMYDADDPGYIGAMKLKTVTGFEAYDMRGKLDGQKDFADFVDKERGNHSYNDLTKLILNIIKT